MVTMKQEKKEEVRIYPEFVDKVDFMRQMGINADSIN